MANIKYATIPAPPGWTIEVDSVFVPLLAIIVPHLDDEIGVSKADFASAITNLTDSISVRGITSSGVVVAAGAAMQGPGGVARNITGAAAAGAANVTEVTITVTDENGDAVEAVHHLDVWLSDAASGSGLTGTSASGTVTNKTASGRIIATHTAKKELRVETLATGVFILEITDTAKTAFKVCASLNGKAVVLKALATADYGA